MEINLTISFVSIQPDKSWLWEEPKKVEQKGSQLPKEPFSFTGIEYSRSGGGKSDKEATPPENGKNWFPNKIQIFNSKRWLDYCSTFLLCF